MCHGFRKNQTRSGVDFTKQDQNRVSRLTSINILKLKFVLVEFEMDSILYVTMFITPVYKLENCFIESLSELACWLWLNLVKYPHAPIQINWHTNVHTYIHTYTYIYTCKPPHKHTATCIMYIHTIPHKLPHRITVTRVHAHTQMSRIGTKTQAEHSNAKDKGRPQSPRIPLWPPYPISTTSRTTPLHTLLPM